LPWQIRHEQALEEMPMAARFDLHDPSDPEQLRPEQRLVEVAAILAAGVVRMRERRRAVLLPQSARPRVRRCRNSTRRTGSSRHDESPHGTPASALSKILSESRETCLEL